jgi:hypothetical protein
MTDFFARLKVRWQAVLAALLTALPVLLDQLGVIDLKPIFANFMPSEYAGLIVGLLPFVLAFLKPLITVEPKG